MRRTLVISNSAVYLQPTDVYPNGSTSARFLTGRAMEAAHVTLSLDASLRVAHYDPASTFGHEQMMRYASGIMHSVTISRSNSYSVFSYRNI